MTKGGFVAIDYIFFAAFLCLSLGVGAFHAIKAKLSQARIKANPNKSETEEFLMGGRKMPILPIALSLLTTFMSGITMLGTPAEVFERGALYWINYQMGTFALVASGLVFLPIFYRLKTTSMFEYFELRFGSRLLRQIASGLFIANTIFYMAVVLYAPAVALSGVTGVDLWPFILIVGLVGTIYTTIGGLKAVVWTDTLQAVFMYGGVGTLIVKGVMVAGGWDRIWRIAAEGNRIAQFKQLSLDPAQYSSIWISSFGGFSFWMSLFGLNQMAVQRYCALPSLKHAYIVMVLTIPAFILLTTLACFIGLIMLAYYWDCNPLDSGEIKTPDQLVILFATDVLSVVPGLPGLFLACLSSSTLSTLSAGLNSMSAVIWEDFLKQKYSHRLTDTQATHVNKALVLLFGCLSTGLAFAAGPMGGIIKASVSMMGALAGPLIGLFCLGVFIPATSRNSALISFFVSTVFVMWICLGNFIANPYKEYTLGTNLNSSCPGNVTTKHTNLGYDPHFGNPDVFYLYRISPFLYPLIGIVLTIITAILSNFVFKSEFEASAADRERTFSLTFFGRGIEREEKKEKEKY